MISLFLITDVNVSHMDYLVTVTDQRQDSLVDTLYVQQVLDF